MAERKVLTELIQLYRHLPCLWDQNSEAYKDKSQKNVGWEALVTKWREIEPDTNVISIKRRIENLKSSYKREAKKVKDSKKKIGSAANEVHRPTLWYFDMMTFLDKKGEQIQKGDTFSHDSESTQMEDQTGKKRRCSLLEKNKRKLIETAPDLQTESPKKINTFGVYVGEQLESLSQYQRQIAEKLISEVIFLAKTENLNFDSRVETHRQGSTFLNYSSPRFPSPYPNSTSSQYYSSSPQYYSPSRHCHSPSPQCVSLSNCSPQIEVKTEASPPYESSHSSSSLPNQVPILTQNVNTCQSPHATGIKQLSPTPPSLFQTKPEMPTPSPQIQLPQIKSCPSSSQHQLPPTTIPSRTDLSIQSPNLSEIIKPGRNIAQNNVEVPTGSLLKELLILKS